MLQKFGGLGGWGREFGPSRPPVPTTLRRTSRLHDAVLYAEKKCAEEDNIDGTHWNFKEEERCR